MPFCIFDVFVLIIVYRYPLAHQLQIVGKNLHHLQLDAQIQRQIRILMRRIDGTAGVKAHVGGLLKEILGDQ